MFQKFHYLPTDIAKTLKHYMEDCGYAKRGINMRLGNLNFLFKNYKEAKMMEMLQADCNKVWEMVQYIEKTLPSGCIISADLHAFKLAWESLHGVEIIKKRVKRRGTI
jgi:hypothetical protein